MTSSSIKILNWNANGLLHRKLELESFLHMHDIDVALVSETHLCSYLNIPKIHNYSVYLANHPSGATRGGSMVIIKKSISHNDIGAFCINSIQASIVVITLNNRNVTIGSIYCPPGSPPQSADFESLVSQLGNHWILGGDFNAKHPSWGSHITSPRGRVIHTSTLQVNCHAVSSTSPTYWPSDPNKLPDIIDFFLVKGLPLTHLRAVGIPDLSSDHIPVLLTYSASPVHTIRSPA